MHGPGVDVCLQTGPMRAIAVYVCTVRSAPGLGEDAGEREEPGGKIQSV